MQVMHTLLRSALLGVGLGILSFCAGGCAGIAGGYRVPEGTTADRNYSSVAGEIVIGGRSSVGKVDTVAGSIRIGPRSHVRHAESVAGSIRLEEGVAVDGAVETVAGDIEIARACTIGGGIETVAGKISVRDSVVQGNIVLRYGKLDLAGTRVVGVVHLKRAKDKDAETPEITVGPGSEVSEIIVDDNTPVLLRIHRTAKVGAVKGAQAEYFE
jgi:predicted acyltransferase (DUF342 family)